MRSRVEQIVRLKKRQFFRGQSIASGEFHYGHLFTEPDKVYITSLWGTEISKENAVEVELETVGQFTGLMDKNLVRIFTRDYLVNENELGGIVGFCYAAFEVLILPELVGISLCDIDRMYDATKHGDLLEEDKSILDTQLKDWKVVTKEEFEEITGVIM